MKGIHVDKFLDLKIDMRKVWDEVVKDISGAHRRLKLKATKERQKEDLRVMSMMTDILLQK